LLIDKITGPESMPLLDHFSWIAPYYDRWFQPDGQETLRSILDLPVSGIILDAGGGTGRVSQQLYGLASSFVIADESFGMLKQALQKDSLIPVCTCTEKLSFANGLFDRILLIDALHHVLDSRQTAAELWRVLKPGGKIVIEEPDIRTFPVKLVALTEKLLLMRSHFLSASSIESLFPDRSARVRVEQDNYRIWVVIDKVADFQTAG
jgi:demethylmenaquinone methyltransferase/2-methoxy-6-polyprenyl-1,4-benzoquinol methylase